MLLFHACPRNLQCVHAFVDGGVADVVVQDTDFLDTTNPARGQFSSLSDLVKMTRMLLNPDQPESLISRAQRDRWLQPVHDFEEDDWTQLGSGWEIIKHKDTHGRLRKIYWRGWSR